MRTPLHFPAPLGVALLLGLTACMPIPLASSDAGTPLPSPVTLPPTHPAPALPAPTSSPPVSLEASAPAPGEVSPAPTGRAPATGSRGRDEPARARQDEPQRPRPAATDIVVILTDDQRAGTEAGLPTVTAELASKGVTYPNAFVPTSWCCPSRASLLTGKFSHRTGVWENSLAYDYGGWPAFTRDQERDTLATRLHSAGYRTGLFGKYLNGLEAAPRGYTPPGWDEFSALVSGAYWNYRLTDDPATGVPKRRDYLTDALGQRTVDFIRSTPPDQPLFAMFTPFAPHMPFDPGPYAGTTRRLGLLPTVQDATGWPNPAVNQDAMTGYPRYVQDLAPSDTFTKNGDYPLDDVLTLTQDMLQGVDANVAEILNALRDTHRLDNTLIVYASDNGYLLGEHRLQRKNVPYDKSIRVPLILRYDNTRKAGHVDPRIAAANLDVYATILDVAGLTPAGDTDGRTLLSPQPARDGLLLEATAWRNVNRPAYCGWREARYLYVRYATGEEELYDYRDDPYELRNRATDPGYARTAQRLRHATKRACTPAPPPRFTWTPGPPAPAKPTKPLPPPPALPPLPDFSPSAPDKDPRDPRQRQHGK